MAEQGFEWYDFLIFSLTLAVSLGIGLYYAFSGGGQKTTQDYLMGGRSLKTVPVALSMVMSYISAILVLGNTAEMYTWGVQGYLTCYGSSIAYALSAFLFVPLFFPLRLTSSFEYIQMRFGSRAVRLTGTALMVISQCLYMGIAMYSPATALDAATGFPTWVSVLLTGVIGTVYTTMGGMKAVIWTDVFQSGVMIGGIVAVFIVAPQLQPGDDTPAESTAGWNPSTDCLDHMTENITLHLKDRDYQLFFLVCYSVLDWGSQSVGGFPQVWEIAEKNGRLNLFDFDPSPLVRQSFWTNIIGSIVSSSQVMTSQMIVQRFCALPTLKQGRNCLLLNIPGTLFMWTLTCLTGLVVFSHYFHVGCDPLRTDLVGNPTQLLPFFIVETLKSKAPGLPGLLTAVLFSGALSTLSSSLNALAAVTWKDVLENRFGNITEQKKTLINKMLVAMYGCIAVACAFGVPFMGEHVSVASGSFVSGVSGPLLGIFLLGAFFPFVNWIGALTGAWVGLLFTMSIALGSNIYNPYRVTLPTNIDNCTDLGSAWNVTKAIPETPTDVPGLFLMSYQWFASLGTVTCVFVGVVVSLLTGPTKASEVDPRLIIPWVDRLFCYLPANFRRKFYFGVDHDSVQMTEDGFYPDVLQKATEETDGNVQEDMRDNAELGTSVVHRKTSPFSDTGISYDNKVFSVTSPDNTNTTYL